MEKFQPNAVKYMTWKRKRKKVNAKKKERYFRQRNY